MSDLDCRTCGACCVGVGDYTHADCTVDDVRRMSRSVRARLLDDQLRPLGSRIDEAATPTNRAGECVFLHGTVGARVSCRIYETRPGTCRAFRVGSAACKRARREVEENLA